MFIEENYQHYRRQGMGEQQEIKDSDKEGIDFDEVKFALGDGEKFNCIVQRILLTLREERNSQRYSIC